MCDFIYQIHDNGGRPFSVRVIGNQCIINDNYDSNREILRFDCLSVMVGNGSSAHELGNTILLHLKNKEYVFIGPEIYSFRSESQIVKYESPVGNNDVPYPYAVNADNDIFLLSENVIIMHNEKVNERMKNYKNPYDYYYDYDLITNDDGYIPPVLSKDPFYRNITKFFIGGNEYTLRYHTDFENDIVNDSDSDQEIYIIDTTGRKVELTKEAYFELLREFGVRQSFYPLKCLTVYMTRR
jgi:hypothetical protein